MAVSAFLLKIMAFDTADIQRNTRQLLKNIKGINKAARECMEANDGALAQLVRDQLLSGRSSTGELIYPAYRSKEYILYKNEREGHFQSLIVNKGLFPARPPETPNLYLSGDLQRGIRVSVRGSMAYATSSDSKYRKIVGKYGKVFGFTDKAIMRFWETTLCDHLEKHLENGVQLY